uniref:Urocanate hydratase n=1 Tax=Caenorhabditis tropicalis TaxID=1561998 RepID=A0A1I7ULW4_9PELO
MNIPSLFVDPFSPLLDPPTEQRSKPVAHAPKRPCNLTPAEKQLAVRNALRYIPKEHHGLLAKEFAEELTVYGHIYAFRFMPNFDLYAPPVGEIPAQCEKAAAIILMILNNLDKRVAQFPQELVTYGGNGQVFSNWIQFRLVLRYLYSMTDHQTLVLYSGHPLGLFPSTPDSPRMTVTNGMVNVCVKITLTQGAKTQTKSSRIIKSTCCAVYNEAVMFLCGTSKNELAQTAIVISVHDAQRTCTGDDTIGCAYLGIGAIDKSEIDQWKGTTEHLGKEYKGNHTLKAPQTAPPVHVAEANDDVAADDED